MTNLIASLRTKNGRGNFTVLLCLVVVLVLPQSGGTVLLVGSTIAFTLQFFLYLDSFRRRNGSLTLAVWLTTFLTVVAAVALTRALVTGRWD